MTNQPDEMSELTQMPEGVNHYNGSHEPCDMLVGPCSCGASHRPGDIQIQQDPPDKDSQQGAVSERHENCLSEILLSGYVSLHDRRNALRILAEHFPDQSAEVERLRAEVDGLKAENIHLQNRVANWEETARHYAQGRDFYQDIVTQIGEPFGVVAKTSDDGSIQLSVLAVKIPELVDHLRERVKVLEAQLSGKGGRMSVYVDPLLNHGWKLATLIFLPYPYGMAPSTEVKYLLSLRGTNHEYSIEECQEVLAALGSLDQEILERVAFTGPLDVFQEQARKIIIAREAAAPRWFFWLTVAALVFGLISAVLQVGGYFGVIPK